MCPPDTFLGKPAINTSRLPIDSDYHSGYSGALPETFNRCTTNRKGFPQLSKNGTTLNQQTTTALLLTEHFRCPDTYIDLAVGRDLSAKSGYFRFGADAICFGQCSSAAPAHSVAGALYDCWKDVRCEGGRAYLPFDPVQVIDNLRYERYKSALSVERKEIDASSLVRSLYYSVRPLMPISVRKHLQRLYFRSWEEIPFPKWPVDFTTERIFDRLLLLSMKARNVRRLPFIWFWPEGAPSCAMMTHDVETSAGRDFCAQLMDINDSFGIKSAFQVIPEKRYTVPQSLLDAIPARGFELNVHDLNHDGHLMRSRGEFMRRAVRINQHGKEFKASGFRSAMLHRNLEWYDALDFSYDMSVPNVAHLDPQRGGCCTVFPFFNGKLLELPVTMTQDYSLFHILHDYSLDRWKQQVALIMENHGLMNFIVHPDYILEAREREMYEALLGYLRTLKQHDGVWVALPGEVDRWWRERSKMRLVEDGAGWRIEGHGRERARIAYAQEEDGRLVFRLADENVKEPLLPPSNSETPEMCVEHVPDSVV